MRRIASVLIASAALVAALGSPAIADDKNMFSPKVDNANILNNMLSNPRVAENANVEILTQD